MITIGIDPGTTRIGFGVVFVKNTRYRAIDYGLLVDEKILSNIPLEKKLLHIHEDFSTLLNKYQPECVGIENLFFGKNVKTALDVASVRGVLLMTCAKYSIPCINPKPNEIKKGITGKGNASKEQLSYMTLKILGITKAPYLDDITDALATAIQTAHSFPPLQNSSY